MQMTSYQVAEFGKPLVQALREAPVPQGVEVVLRITRCGVCHSDVHMQDGYFDLGGGHNIRATVYLEAGSMHRADGPEAMRPVGETEFANGVAAMAASGRGGGGWGGGGGA